MTSLLRMDESEISKDEEQRLLEKLQQGALYGFPNPDRIGCPGSEFLRKLAFDRKAIPISDPTLSHVAHCSPCFREFAQLRAVAGKRARNHRLALIAATVSVFTIGGVVVRAFIQNQSRSYPSPAYVAASLDLKDRSVVRGSDDPPHLKMDSLRLPRDRVSLTIRLPFASETGKYEVRILRDLGDPLLTASGDAQLSAGKTLLNVRLNLAALPSGHYVVGIRRVPLDWTYHPVTIE